jgi:hypothetical protein
MPESSFQFLSVEEFERLSLDDRINYLLRADEFVTQRQGASRRLFKDSQPGDSKPTETPPSDVEKKRDGKREPSIPTKAPEEPAGGNK